MARNENFLPEDYIERRVRRRTDIFSTALFVVVMGGIVAAFYVTDRQRAEVRAQQHDINDQFQVAAKRLEQLDELQVQKAQMLHKAKVAAVLVERIPRSLILSEIINSMPLTLSLLELKLETTVVQNRSRATTALDKAKQAAKKKKGAAGTSQVEVKPTKIEIQLVGVAPTDVEVAQFMSSLRKNPLVNDINLAYSRDDDIDDMRMRRFKVDLTINQEVDVEQLVPNKVKRQLKQNPMGNTIRINPNDQIAAPEKKASFWSRFLPSGD